MKTSTSKVGKIQKQVEEVIARVTGLSPQAIDINVPLAKFGVDSLIALSVVAAIEKQLKIRIPERRLRSIKSTKDLIAVVVDVGGDGKA